MRGRTESKIKVESAIQSKLETAPEYLVAFYYSLNQKTHMTKLRYIGNVIRYIEYLSGGNLEVSLDEIKKINAFDIQKYMSDINYFDKADGIHEMSAATKACIYSSLNAFFEFLVRNDYIKANPFAGKKIERPRIKENDIIFLTPEEVNAVQKQILEGVGTDRAKAKQEKWKYRDLLLFRIPVVNGIRVNALREIDIDDIHLNHGYIRVTEKGNITKNVYIDTETARLLRLWLVRRSQLIGDSNCKALFISNQRNRMTVMAIENIIKKYTEAVTSKHITPHKLRSTCGTNLYQAKKDIYLVASVLGHKTTEPTRRYAKVFETDKRNAVNVMGGLYAAPID